MSNNGVPGYHPDWEIDEEEEEAEVERHLAQYAFVREERDREVRLLFRDVSPTEIARAFRAAGASLISISGEREQRGAAAGIVEAGPAADDHPSHRKRARHAPTTASPHTPPSGELLLRYFYSAGETVYTVSIVVPSGVAGSIAGIFPTARHPERELQDRLAAVFV
jgi:Ni,Fe-hydrogenase III component G